MTSARELFESLHAPNPPLVLDVRNTDDYARGRIESAAGVASFNLPYFEFIEEEDAAVAKALAWLEPLGAGPSRRDGNGRDLVIVCAKGDSSEYVADLLRARGVEASSLEGGMLSWGTATVERPITPSRLAAWQVNRFGKGCLSYVLAAGEDAIVVDPHRDTRAYHEFLERRRLTPRAVFDTHLHADHLSGAADLARAAGVPYYAHPADFEGAAFAFEPLHEGTTLRLGKVDVSVLRFISAPGHTPGSTLLLTEDGLLFSGDTIFVNSVGRPDLAGKTEEWAKDLHRTLHERMAAIPDGALVLPAHSGGPREARPDGTIAAPLGALRRGQPELQLREAEFVQSVQRSITPAPRHYARIRDLNAGSGAASEEERTEMELGRNECAMSRRA